MLHIGDTWRSFKNFNAQAHPVTIKSEVQGWDSGIGISVHIQDWGQDQWATKNQGAHSNVGVWETEDAKVSDNWMRYMKICQN